METQHLGLLLSVSFVLYVRIEFRYSTDSTNETKIIVLYI